MDKYSIDDHKLMYHTKRVNDWMENKPIYPIYIDISPSGVCNHRCKFCCMDYMGYKHLFLDKNIFEKRITEMSKLGVKSVLFAGQGEPLLNKDVGDMIITTRKVGIDIALTTNGVLLNKEFIDKSLSSLSWIKISCAAGTKETHAKVHRTNVNDFDTIFSNLEYTIKVKKENGYKTVIGMQCILLPENADEIESLTERVKNVGLNYLMIKPYSKSTFALNDLYHDVNYNKYLYLSDKLKKFNDKNFYVAYRMDSMNNWDEKYRGYKECLSLPFATTIDASGGVYGCCAYLGNKNLYYGNIYKNTFEEIWNSKEREDALNWAHTKLDLTKCQINCRMDKVNKYLWDLKHPIEHVNFI